MIYLVANKSRKILLHRGGSFSKFMKGNFLLVFLNLLSGEMWQKILSEKKLCRVLFKFESKEIKLKQVECKKFKIRNSNSEILDLKKSNFKNLYSKIGIHFLKFYCWWLVWQKILSEIKRVLFKF